MRKANTVQHPASVHNAPVSYPVPTHQCNALALLIDRDYASQVKRINEYRESIAQYKAQTHKAMQLWQAQYKQLKRTPTPTQTNDTLTKSQALYEQLLHHTCIDTVKVDTKNITVYTRLLFGNIRTREGSSTMKRRCLGAFSFTIPIVNFTASRYDVSRATRIQNLLYTKGTYAHYAVNGGTPCYGEYEHGIQALYDEGKWYELINTIIEYLQCAGDGGAWRKSHVWIDNRLSKIPKLTGTGRVRSGASLILTHDYISDGEVIAEKGTKHKVLRSNDGAPVISGTNGNTYTIYSGDYTIISNELYQRIETSKDIERMYFDKLDALPDGAPLIEAQHIINA